MPNKPKPSACIRGEPPKTIDEVRKIVVAEFLYWQEHLKDQPEFSMGATAAVANIDAALLGMRAPWHPVAK